MKNLIIMLLAIFVNTVYAQESTFNSEEIIIGSFVEGTLLLPDAENPSLVIMIPGSGPTDRDGNQAMQKNNSLRFLAEGLYEKNIATYRYDKRLTKIMKMGQLDESKINFDHFIEDAMEVLAHFQNDERFNRITVLGHSQGSLVAMIAAQNGADAYISLAGAGQAIDDVIVDQLAKQAPGLKDNARESFNDMRLKGVAENYSPGLSSIFRPSLQPFLISWMKYEPQEEIAKLDIPVLVVNGDKDLQVQVSEAEMLAAANTRSKLVIIENMNHIFKEIQGNDLENQKSYNEYKRPVMPKLIDEIASFLTSE
ncbi:alpha/beta hydrolase [Aureitalea sp. L0-47]|uniref:alpha/beta hydrolase n=1 Tax=Aureitalea sp. L0-47 TaxID=2816962 RepID=UPI002237649B|nr:alpha/beta hydrolase [Aureitalea sp. L0-47]MCW5520257.1 alpha/beta hydrolase [Aureitalea sp. L0-47]